MSLSVGDFSQSATRNVTSDPAPQTASDPKSAPASAPQAENPAAKVADEIVKGARELFSNLAGAKVGQAPGDANAPVDKPLLLATACTRGLRCR